MILVPAMLVFRCSRGSSRINSKSTEIVSDIHLSGPKQAIVKSIISCCTDLEITLVAEGIEKIEEWCWLEYAGIRRFGLLFARPQLNGVGDIHWLHRVG